MFKESFAFQVHITDECDQRCQHCYIFAEEAGRSIQSMTWKQMQDVVSNACDMCRVYNRTPYFYVTGGDPILHPDFWRFMELLSKREIASTVMGNPFHLTPDVCRRLRENGCIRYQLSVDGLRETHDQLRKPGSFDCTIGAINTIKKAGLRCLVMTTVSSLNVHEIPDVIDVVTKSGADVHAFARYCPTSDKKNTGISPLGYRSLLEKCSAKFRALEAAGYQTYFSKKDHLWTLYEFETGEFTIPPHAEPGIIYGGCNCGNCHLTILPNGDVMACRRVADSNVGNAFSDRLADIWINEMEVYRDYSRFEKCSYCELLAWCRGCPAVARGAGGGFYSADPQCWKEVSCQ